jgi:drug/metabolite transporter (DMT)-like permease
MTQDLARKRFFLLTMLRFGGVALAFVGISIIAKRWIEPAEIVGGLLLVVAIVDVVVVPTVLIRRWRREE